MLGVFTWVLIIVATFYCLVCQDRHEAGFMSDLRMFFLETLPDKFKKLAKRVCGERIVQSSEQLVTYVLYKPNPIVQIVYAVCAGGGFFIYVTYGFCHLPNPYVDEYHKITGTIVMLLCYYSYYKACAVNPGYLSKDTDIKRLKQCNALFAYDGVLYTEDSKCRTCTVQKPARSKHCVVCDQCVLKFDHHCIWINQCVGYHNYKWFLSFLILHALLTLYGFVIGLAILMHLVDKGRLMEVQYMDTRTGELVKASWTVVIQYLTSVEQAFTGVVILCAVVSIMLLFFFGYHMHLVYLGVTTNEKIKMSQLRHYLARAISFMERWIEMKRSNEPFEPSEESLKLYGVNKDWKLEKITSELEEARKDLASVQ